VIQGEIGIKSSDESEVNIEKGSEEESPCSTEEQYLLLTAFLQNMNRKY
jgi:hypothetical protein